VDFGAVQDTYQNTLTGGSTVVGTYGYIAPEQFSGQATLATDLYSLGATLLFLLSRRDPADLPQRKLKIDFRPYIQVSPAFADWLDRMLDPIAEDRFQSAKEALAVLQGEQVYAKSTYQTSRHQTKSSITLKQNGSKLTVEIPPVWFRSPISRSFALLPIAASGFVSILLLILLVLTLGTLKGVESRVWLLLGGFILADVLIVGRFLLSAAVTHCIEIDLETISLRRLILGLSIQRIKSQTAHIKHLDLKTMMLKLNHQQTLTVCEIQIKRRRYDFGAFLPESEKVWLIEELRSFLKTLSG
jgi:serine/threonine protein kinase